MDDGAVMPAGGRSGPVIYEINTWLWLDGLSVDAGALVTLGDVPEAEWNRLAAMAIDTVWLMGAWERSPAGTEVARDNVDLSRLGSSLLADFTPDLVVGSPYCVRSYQPDRRLGGFAGLEVARQKLRARGLRLLLDFVPNHVAPDHAWVSGHPEFLIGGDEADLEQHPDQFTRPGGAAGDVVAFGRDPFSAPWTDVIQVNTFHPGLRADTVEVLSRIAEHCDGVRCDMAMLAINDVFHRTWGDRAGPVPAQEYWSELIPAVRASHPDFTFVAEAYWDREWELLQQGFDYCYDKVLYDRVIRGDATAVRLHLGADLSYQQRLVRFIENHDEDRAAAAMTAEAARAAAVTVATLPGATLYYDGQFEGRRIRLPVALGRRPNEPVDAALADFYGRLLAAARTARVGEWQLCPVTGWPDDQSSANIVAWSWSTAVATFVVAVNFSGSPAHGEVRLPIPLPALPALPSGPFAVPDLLSGHSYTQDPIDLRDRGLYVGLGPHGFHLLHFPNQ